MPASSVPDPFINTRRKEDELRRRPWIEIIYHSVFGPEIQIERHDRIEDEVFILDRYYAIDGHIRLPRGNILTFQEKTRKATAPGFDLTVEYYNDPAIDEQGDWFHLAAQIYFVGKANTRETDFQQWAIIDLAALALADHRGQISWSRRQNNWTRADFLATPIRNLPTAMIIAINEGLGEGFCGA